MTIFDCKYCFKSLLVSIILLTIFCLNCNAKDNPKKAYGIVSVEVKTETSTEDDTERDFKIANDFILTGFIKGWNVGFKNGEVESYLESNFGKPVSKNVKTVPSREPGLNLEMSEVFFDGVIVLHGKWVNQEGVWIEKISVISDKYPIKYNLKVGATRKDVIEKLGKPYSEYKGRLEYNYWGDITVAVVFEFDEDKKIKSIHWIDYDD